MCHHNFFEMLVLSLSCLFELHITGKVKLSTFQGVMCWSCDMELFLYPRSTSMLGMIFHFWTESGWLFPPVFSLYNKHS